jgi:hypothetical protein
MKSCLFSKPMAAALALALLALSAGCVYPRQGYWHGPWRGPDYYHRS